jgi:hypothetical protein
MNEITHAFFDQFINGYPDPCCVWVRQMMNRETSLFVEEAGGYKPRLPEEAVSEMIDHATNVFVAGSGNLPGPQGHDHPHLPAPNKKVSVEIRNLSIWLMFNGCKDPCDSSEGYCSSSERERRLAKFFETAQGGLQ